MAMSVRDQAENKEAVKVYDPSDKRFPVVDENR